MSSPGLVVFGLASDGTVGQWDGHPPHRGVMLRWFLDEFHLPEFGFDVYRAQIPDIPPLPFDDTTVAAIAGTPSWTYAGIVTLSCPAGLTFEPSSLLGNNRLVITPNAPVTVTFHGLAWLLRIHAETAGAGIDVAALVDGRPVQRQDLAFPGAELFWRTRGLREITITGDGSISFIGFHLLDDARYWTHLAHRCLPVDDPNYACGPPLTVTEAEEARSRLPAPVAGKWAARFDTPFSDLLPALRRLARGDPPAAVPPDTLDPRQPRVAAADERTFIKLASLDPHVARMLGLAYDDAVVLDGREYAYKVVGTWRGQEHVLDLSNLSLAQVARLLTRAGAKAQAGRRRDGLDIGFPQGAADLSLEVDPHQSLEWIAEDTEGNRTDGTLGGRGAAATLDLKRVAVLRLAWTAAANVALVCIRWNDLEQSVGLLPSVFAQEPGPPRGPLSIAAMVRLPVSPSGSASADLDWPLPVAPDGTVNEGDVIAYQVGHRQLAADPAAPAPSPGAVRDADVLRPLAPIFLSMDSVLRLPPDRVLYRDDDEARGLAAGVWGWWVRGVDLFGRVSDPSAWTTAPVEDVAPAPSPLMVQAEWVQRDLPEITVSVVGRSVEANRWLAASAADEGLVASWTLPPEQTEFRNDVDGFQLLLRTAQTQPGAPAGAALVYPTWPAPIATFGPIAINSTGVVTAAPAANPSLAVTLSAGQTMPASPHAPKAPTTAQTAFRTDLELDGASSVFVGGTLTIGGTALPIVANSDGPNLVVVVEHAVNSAPVAGAATLRAPAGRLIEIASDAPTLPGAAGLVARSGVLQAGDRFVVLRRSGTAFLCLRPVVAAGPLPAAGDSVTWHPVWCAALDEAGFGPSASASVPVLNAQVAIRAVRLIQTTARVSATSAPLTVTAVDVERPDTPGITPIVFDPAGTCAQLASRADWYGESRFTFNWNSVPFCSYTVYRAMADEVFRLDREHLKRGGTRDLTEGMWPPGVWSDAARKARVQTDLAALEAGRPNADEWEAAYDRLRVDAQMLIARQVQAWPAFMPLFGRPIAETTYTDTLNGRTRAHWLYAVTARSRAGSESAPSEISPPICCPDVVPPAPPLTHSALAAEGAVKLKWLSSPDADTHHYEIFASRTPETVQDLDTLTPVTSYAVNEQPSSATTTYAPTPHASGKAIERLVPRTRQEMGEWCFWVVAVDTSGNRSSPSRMLRGRALKLPPEAPVWIAPSRIANAVMLSWLHPSDQRLACMVERKRDGAERWVAVTDWLPRGVYAYQDAPSELDAAWVYRVRVRDHENRHATEIPEVLLPEVP